MMIFAYRSFVLILLVLPALVFPRSASAQDYLVGEGDVLKIAVYDHPDLATVTRVTAEGTIIFPLIGQVSVNGMTVAQISAEIAEHLSNGYVVNPQVSVFIEEYRSKKVVIIGEVKNPGLYTLPGQASLLELLSKAGGPTKDSGDRASIKRKGSGGERLIEIDLKKLLTEEDLSFDIQILDGDTIYVQKASVVYVTGEVRSSGAYRYDEGLTVVKAITMAGGFTEKASAGRVKIMRKESGREMILERAKMDELVRPDDVIIVPESLF